MLCCFHSVSTFDTGRIGCKFCWKSAICTPRQASFFLPALSKAGCIPCNPAFLAKNGGSRETFDRAERVARLAWLLESHANERPCPAVDRISWREGQRPLVFKRNLQPGGLAENSL